LLSTLHFSIACSRSWARSAPAAQHLHTSPSFARHRAHARVTRSASLRFAPTPPANRSSVAWLVCRSRVSVTPPARAASTSAPARSCSRIPPAVRMLLLLRPSHSRARRQPHLQRPPRSRAVLPTHARLPVPSLLQRLRSNVRHQHCIASSGAHSGRRSHALSFLARSPGPTPYLQPAACSTCSESRLPCASRDSAPSGSGRATSCTCVESPLLQSPFTPRTELSYRLGPLPPAPSPAPRLGQPSAAPPLPPRVTPAPGLRSRACCYGCYCLCWIGWRKG
jgi:hypothetical protein